LLVSWIVAVLFTPLLGVTILPARMKGYHESKGRLGQTFARLLLCWFLDAGKKKAPQAQLTGVQKAPRHSAKQVVPNSPCNIGNSGRDRYRYDGRSAPRRIRPAHCHAFNRRPTRSLLQPHWGASSAALPITRPSI
jgi:hypothetical protein